MLSAPDRCLRLSQSLLNGQAFRWHSHSPQPFPPAKNGLVEEFSGAIGPHVYLLRQAKQEPPSGEADTVWYRVLTGAAAGHSERQEEDRVLCDYLRLDDDQTSIMATMCQSDARFNHVFPYLRGVRVIRTPPAECLFSFICSANNNLPRIAGMVRFLARRYGELLADHDGVKHYQFPSVQTLAKKATEAELREAGFGYRAKYIVETAQSLQLLAEQAGMSAEEVLEGWRGLSRTEVAKKLVKFAGIGRKVAGCIALFSLDQLGEVPCDTHIWQIAAREMPDIRQKSLTNRVYDQIGDFFRSKFGEQYAGLAQTILFTAELPQYGKLVPGNDLLERVSRKRAKSQGKASSVEVCKKEVKTVKVEKEESVAVLVGKEEDVVLSRNVKEEAEEIVVEEKIAKGRRAKRKRSSAS